MKLITVISTATILFIASANAQTDANPIATGNNLIAALQDCNAIASGTSLSQERTARAFIALGYIQGIVEQNGLVKGHELFTVPKDVPLIQARRIVLKYLEDHPATLNEPSVLLINTALYQAFAASKTNSSPSSTP